jgi:hypothetical protein
MNKAIKKVFDFNFGNSNLSEAQYVEIARDVFGISISIDMSQPLDPNAIIIYVSENDRFLDSLSFIGDKAEEFQQSNPNCIFRIHYDEKNKRVALTCMGKDLSASYVRIATAKMIEKSLAENKLP